MEIDNGDWRLNGQMRYLNNAVLKRICFIPSVDELYHKHCAFCWDKFSDEPGTLKFGYSTLDNKHWICEVCYKDFKELFNWSIVNACMFSNDDQQN